MNPTLRRLLPWLIAVLLLVVACLLFPRVLAFVELAARELRYLWWLVAIAALGIWMAFFYGRRKS